MTTPALNGGSARRAIFLDFDGTYAHHGVVPQAHAQAMAAARARGHLVFLCTGRPLSLVPKTVLAAGFDGLVATAGAYVECAGHTLLDVRFSEELASRALKQLDAHHAIYMIETPEATFARRSVVDTMTERARRAEDQVAAGGLYWILDSVTVQEDLSTIRPSKITAFSGSMPLLEVARLIGPEVDVVAMSLGDRGAGAGEMFLSGVNKATGIAPALAHLGLTWEDVVACGDGPNDLEMLTFAGTSVVIEGSPPELLDTADLVAAGPEQAGLVEAFVTLGLIKGS